MEVTGDFHSHRVKIIGNNPESDAAAEVH
jgi:hypothetical protein